MSDRLRLDELTRDEVSEQASRTTVVIPLGSTEQHGRHLPLAVDSLVITRIAELAASRARADVPVLVAPTLPYGFAHHHLDFAGTMSIPMLTYVEALTEIGASLAHGGFRRIVLLNGHGGNESPSGAAADRLVYERRLPVHVAAAAYWVLASEALAEAGLKVAVRPGHAGGFETSILMALRPDLVQLDRRPSAEAAPQAIGRPDLPRAHIRREGIWRASDGRSDDAHAADPVEGRRIVEIVVASVSDFIVRFHRSVPDAP